MNINKLKSMCENQLSSPFPYDDIRRLQQDLHIEFEKISSDFSSDLHSFCMAIAGSISYLLSGMEIPKLQQDFIQKNFFEMYPHYTFVKEKITNYPTLCEELKSFEEAREILYEIVEK